MRADICPREDERIAALRAYDILVDRQWLKAEVGLGIRPINAYAAKLGGEATFAAADPGVELRVRFSPV